MASEDTLQTRIVSGTGLLRIPKDNRIRRLYTLFAQIIRYPKSPYLNMKSNPPEGFFARITCVKEGIVYRCFDQTFPMQAWEFNADISMQTLTAVKCQYKGILQSFVNLGVALNITPVSVNDSIKDFKPLSLPFDEFRIVCYADTAIKLTLKALELDICNGADEVPISPPSSPPTPAQVPSNVPIKVDEPYPDDTISKKSDLDKNYVEPPQGVKCTAYIMDIIYTTSASPTQEQTTRVGAWGEIGKAYPLPSDTKIIALDCRGIVGREPCGTYAPRGFFSSNAQVLTVKIANLALHP